MEEKTEEKTAEKTVKYATCGHTWFDPWEEREISRAYRLARPSAADINRFNKEVGKAASSAQRNLILGAIHPEEKEKILADMESWPGLTATLTAWLLKASGLSADLGN